MEVASAKSIGPTQRILKVIGLPNFDGENVKDGTGRRIATLQDIKKVIDGVGGTSLVSLWLLVLR